VKLNLDAFRPYQPMVYQVTREEGWNYFRFAGIGFRESQFGALLYPPNDPCGRGDDPDGPQGPIPGYGCGLFQIDRRYHLPFINSPAFKSPAEQARYAIGVLKSNREWFQAHGWLGETDDTIKARMVYAAYNCGVVNVRKAILATPSDPNPDLFTTGNDYSAWVLAAADLLANLMPLQTPASVV
jgi:hypothetical protein